MKGRRHPRSCPLRLHATLAPSRPLALLSRPANRPLRGHYTAGNRAATHFPTARRVACRAAADPARARDWPVLSARDLADAVAGYPGAAGPELHALLGPVRPPEIEGQWRGLAGVARAGRMGAPATTISDPATHRLARVPLLDLQMDASNYFIWLAAIIMTTVGSFFLGFAVGTLRPRAAAKAGMTALQHCWQCKGCQWGEGLLAAPITLLLPPSSSPQCLCRAMGPRHWRCSPPSPLCSSPALDSSTQTPR